MISPVIEGIEVTRMISFSLHNSQAEQKVIDVYIDLFVVRSKRCTDFGRGNQRYNESSGFVS